MLDQNFPPGWEEDRVKRLIEFYDEQSEAGAIAEDEAATEGSATTFMEISVELVPEVRDLLSRSKH